MIFQFALLILNFECLSSNRICFIADQDHCFFRYGFASAMVPCCLEIITRVDYEESGKSYTSDTIAWHDFCPVTPDEAHKLWQSHNSG